MEANTKKWLLFFGTSLMILLANIDTTIVNLALAVIAQELETSLTQIQWVINAYLLTTIIFFIVGGKLSDLFSLKRIFLIGTLFFIFSSLLAGFAPNFPTLIIARLIQGVGFAFTLSLALLIIANAFPSNQRGFVLGLSVTVTGLGQAIGPTIGGIILENLNWHWIFLINVPIASLSFILVFLFEKETKREGEDKMDYIGVMLFATFIILLLLSLNLLSSNQFHLHTFILGIVAACFVFVIFSWKEIKSRFPLIDFKLFLTRNYSLSISIRFLFMYTYGTFLFFIPLYLQNMLGFTPLFSGLVLLVYSSLFGLCSPLTGIWIDQISYKLPIIFAIINTIIAFILIANINVGTSLTFVLIGLSFFGISCGILFPSTIHSTISSLPKRNTGEGLGMFFTVAFIGTSLGVALSGAQMHYITTNAIASSAQIHESLDDNKIKLLHSVANGTQPIIRLKDYFSDYSAISQIAQQSFLRGLNSVMKINILLAFMMTILALSLKKDNL